MYGRDLQQTCCQRHKTSSRVRIFSLLWHLACDASLTLMVIIALHSNSAKWLHTASSTVPTERRSTMRDVMVGISPNITLCNTYVVLRFDISTGCQQGRYRFTMTKPRCHVQCSPATLNTATGTGTIVVTKAASCVQGTFHIGDERWRRYTSNPRCGRISISIDIL